MKKQQRIIDALVVLKNYAPGLYGSIVNGSCPHEVGLDELTGSECRLNGESDAFIMGFCEGCWNMALEGKS